MSELDAFPLPLKRMIKGREDSGLSSKHIPCPHFSYYKWSTQTTHCLCLCLQYVCSSVFVLCVLSICSISSSLNSHTSHHSLLWLKLILLHLVQPQAQLVTMNLINQPSISTLWWLLQQFYVPLFVLLALTLRYNVCFDVLIVPSPSQSIGLPLVD